MRPFGLATVALLAALSGPSCGDDETTPPVDHSTRFVFDLTADLSSPEHFWDQPYPSDLRLDAEGHPKLTGFPNPFNVANVTGLIENASEAKGFAVIPVGYLRFSAPIESFSATDVIAGEAASKVWLLDVDPNSPDRGKFIPTVAKTLEVDGYTEEGLLAIAPRPGIILRPGTSYAFVATRSLRDASGQPLASNDVLERLKINKPESDAESIANTLFNRLWDTLEEANLNPDDVIAATVFTTGKVVEETAAMGDKVLAAHDIAIDDLALDTTLDFPELCVLRGNVTLPQFQKGEPSFTTEGRFELGADGVPIEQRTEVAPIVIVIPRTEMPAEGYPLIVNIHGSGGYAIAPVLTLNDEGLPENPIGPAFPHALKGIATAGMAMPLNPERYPGAVETEYLNVNNFAAMRDTFRQGIFEARLYLEALKTLELDPALLADCTGPTLPAGPGAPDRFKFDTTKLAIMGQSMGGMYTNLIGATEPDFKIAVPTGAGGHWTYFLLITELRNGAIPNLLALLFQTEGELTHLHPVLSLGAAAVEAADPMIYMPHVARRPLEGHPARPIYEPAGIGDSYFPTPIYDAAALAYGHPQAGFDVWPEMQDALELIGLDGFEDLPLENNLVSENGDAYTGAILQFEGDGTYDPHSIYIRRDDVKRQYSCFLDSFFKTGVARIVPLEDNWRDPCPE